MSSPLIELHIWQTVDTSVYTLDPNCLAALLVLQLSIPGQFCLVVESTPDASPSGTLPYLKDGHKAVSGYSDILRYVAGSGRSQHVDLDAHLNKSEKARNAAWTAHIESQLAMLVTHQLFVVTDNWAQVTHRVLIANMSLPYRYYVPHRFRDAQKARLEAAGLWETAVPKEEGEPKTFAERQMKLKEKLSDQNFSRTFGRQKVLEKARTILKTYDTLLEDRQFCALSDSLSSLDVLLAAHIIVLSEVSYPDPFLQALLAENFPSLVAHAQRVRQLAFGNAPPHHSGTTSGSSLASLIPWPRWSASTLAEEQSIEWKQLQRSYAIQRWGWIALATIGTVGYFWTYGLPLHIRLQRGDAEEEDDYIREDD